MNVRQKTVLIIDDDEAIRDYLEHILKKVGFTTFLAENGVEGLVLCKNNSIDIIITDLVMPEKEGIETIQEILRNYPSCKIIAMSGAINRDNYLMITKALGAHAILAKPFDGAAVLESIRHVYPD